MILLDVSIMTATQVGALYPVIFDDSTRTLREYTCPLTMSSPNQSCLSSDTFQLFHHMLMSSSRLLTSIVKSTIVDFPGALPLIE